MSVSLWMLFAALVSLTGLFVGGAMLGDWRVLTLAPAVWITAAVGLAAASEIFGGRS